MLFDHVTYDGIRQQRDQVSTAAVRVGWLEAKLASVQRQLHREKMRLATREIELRFLVERWEEQES